MRIPRVRDVTSVNELTFEVRTVVLNKSTWWAVFVVYHILDCGEICNGRQTARGYRGRQLRQLRCV